MIIINQELCSSVLYCIRHSVLNLVVANLKPQNDIIYININIINISPPIILPYDPRHRFYKTPLTLLQTFYFVRRNAKSSDVDLLKIFRSSHSLKITN